jgi:phosphoglycerate dehydrogenase-like enzyme
MNISDKVAVCSRSFSKNEVLRSELLQRYKYVTFNDSGAQLEGQDLVNFLEGHDKAITALETINESILSQIPRLKVIGKYGVGLNMIDMSAMRKYKVSLGWTGGVNRRSVSEMVISLSISLLRHFPLSNQEVKNNKWQQHVGGLLSGKVIGVIGCGFVGKDLIELLSVWGCKFLAHDILNFPEFYEKYKIQAVSLDNLLKESDVVTLHVPFDETTKNMLSKEKLALMKPTAILINAARGGLVDESAVKKMLIEKKLAAAAFDVFINEPPSDFELLNLPNFFATPHLGGSAYEAIIAMGKSAIDGLDLHSIP